MENRPQSKGGISAALMTRIPAIRRFLRLKFWAMLLTDTAVIIAAIIFSYLIRLDFDLSKHHIRDIKTILGAAIPIKLAVFYLYGAYRGMWRYTGIRDVARLGQASLVGTLLVVFYLVYYYRFGGFSRAVFIMEPVFTFLLTSSLRISARFWSKSRSPGLKSTPFWTLFSSRKGATKALIIGAGDAGARILHETQENPSLNYDVVCFMDDDPAKIGRTLHNVPIIGPVDFLLDVINKYKINEILIAIPSASGAKIRRIVELCEKSGCAFKTLPTLGEIMDGRVSIKKMRDVDYRDLLGRSPVELDTRGIAEYIDHRVVLITGAGGSIGSELCRQVIRFQPSQLVLLDSCEYNLYQIQIEIDQELKYHDHIAYLGLVQDRALLKKIFAAHRPQVIFHAAAYKHVPMLEANPWQAVENNIEGSTVIIETSREYEVERFVLVSTDKAVFPTNVMGASKRAAEMILQAQPPGKTKFMAVRFGNVLGSSGSVVPLFRQQIQRGGPVTVTHPEVTRYFMTIPEAVQLILQSGSMGQGGEIFVLDMGTPVKIAEMARDLIRLSGKEPDKDIEIVFTGLRPGEKLYEELITRDELVSATRHEKIKLLRTSDGATVKTTAERNIDLDSLLKATTAHDALGVRLALAELVPEFKPAPNSF